ncbi:hypothetical protein D2917_32495 (plasmid) [Cupriavidus oxalaticus]|uniref:Uncharacterized protein n=1 Tax=Cupriavidus oxalaticus TaxID=96344 RepID=A0A5P3VRJ7_9BURK|nr:hypothetical protein D2917_32495 [Cupriavidus oxalaticus]
MIADCPHLGMTRVTLTCAAIYDLANRFRTGRKPNVGRRPISHIVYDQIESHCFIAAVMLDNLGRNDGAICF